MELKQTLIDVFSSYPFSNLITIDASGLPKGRMMENMSLGDDLVCWFATGAQSAKVAEIQANARAAVYLYRPEDHCSICFQGTAEVVVDDAVRAEKWNPRWEQFWKAGPSDPNFALIRVTPAKVTYVDWPQHKTETLEL